MNKACIALQGQPWQVSVIASHLDAFQVTCSWCLYLLKNITLSSSCSHALNGKRQLSIGLAVLPIIFKSPWRQKKMLLTCLLFLSGRLHLLAVKGQAQVKAPSNTGRSCKCSLQCLRPHQPEREQTDRNVTSKRNYVATFCYLLTNQSPFHWSIQSTVKTSLECVNGDI